MTRDEAVKLAADVEDTLHARWAAAADDEGRLAAARAAWLGLLGVAQSIPVGDDGAIPLVRAMSAMVKAGAGAWGPFATEARATMIESIDHVRHWCQGPRPFSKDPDVWFEPRPLLPRLDKK